MPIERVDRPDERPRATGGKKQRLSLGKSIGNLKISFVNVLHFLKLLLYFLVICVIFCHFGKWKKIFKNDYHVAAQIQGTSAEKSWKAG